MFKLIVSEKGGASKEIEFDKDEITIGRVPGNDIVLPGNNVSKRHSRVVRQGDRFYVVDLKSTNGTYLNGRRIMTPSPLNAGDKVFVGNFVVVLDGEPGAIVAGDADMPMDAGSLVEPIPLDDPPESMPPPAIETPGPTARPTFAGGPAVRQSQSTQPMSTAPALAASLGMGQSKPNLSSTLPQGTPASSRGVQTPALRPTPQPSSATSASPSTPPPASGPANAPTRPAMGAMRPPTGAGAPAGGTPNRPTNPTGQSANWNPPASSAAGPAARQTPPVAMAAPVPVAEPRPTHPTLPEALADDSDDPPPVLVVPSAPPASNASSVSNNGPAMEPHQPKPNVNAATLSVASQVVDAVIQTHRAGIEPTPPSHEYAALLASVVADAKEAGVSAVGAEMGDAATRSRVRSVVENLARRKTALPNGVTHDRLIRDVVAEITGAGAIELALDEVDVTSIFVSPSGRVSVGRGDAAGPSPYWFSSSSAVSTAVDRLLKIAGASRVADQAYVEAVLGDGSRLTVVYAPGASAPSVAIERASKRAPAMADLVAREMCSSAVVTVLQRALEARRNVIVVGPRGSGRSTLVAALASHSANHGERVVALEARAELSAAHRDVVSVPIGKDGKRAVEVAAAMRPQRMIFAHVDDHSVSAFVGNLVTGAEGVIAVLDGASLHNALQRAAGAVAASAGSSLSKDDVLQQIAASRPLLVQLTRLGDGSARVVSVAEASESAGKMLQIDELYRLQLGPQNDRGRLSAQWPSSGHTPSFLR